MTGGAGFLPKRGSWHFFFLILHIEIILRSAKLCCTSEKKFSATTILRKKVILSCLKMKLRVCVRKIGVLG